MAYIDPKHPSFTAVSESALQTCQENGAKRRYHYCKSAPTNSSLRKNNNSEYQSSIPSSAKSHLSLRKVIFLLALYVGAGTLCFYLFKDEIKGKKTNGVTDAMYFCIVTMTTVGYGDIVPNTVASKLFACAFVFVGMALVGLILGKAADYLVEKQERALVKALSYDEKLGATEMVKDIKTNKVKYKLLISLSLLLVLILVGNIVLYKLENMDFVDSFYCVSSTITTLGFGDKSFSTHAGRLFAVFWIPTSTICLAQCLLYLAELNTAQRQKLLVDWILSQGMTQLDLDKADIDHDRVVCAAEFAIHKLKEMGKITEEEISQLVQKFEDQGVDKHGH